MNRRRFSSAMVLLAMAVLLIAVSAPGCGDPNREVCKKACERIYACDQPETGGAGALNDAWLSSCKSACEEADEIDEEVANCLIKTDCASMSQNCGAGGN